MISKWRYRMEKSYLLILVSAFVFLQNSGVAYATRPESSGATVSNLPSDSQSLKEQIEKKPITFEATTKSLQLQTVTKKDIKSILDFVSASFARDFLDPAAYCQYKNHPREEDRRAHIGGFFEADISDPNNLSLKVVESETGKTVGFVSILGMNQPMAMLSFGVDPGQQRRRIMSSALRAVIPSLFQEGSKITSLKAIINKGNSASENTLKTAGFHEVKADEDDAQEFVLDKADYQKLNAKDAPKEAIATTSKMNMPTEGHGGSNSSAGTTGSEPIQSSTSVSGK